MRTRVQRWGNSLALRIPKALAVSLGLSDGVAVEPTVLKGRLVVEPASFPKLADLLAAITHEELHGVTDWGEPVGREVW